MNEDIELWHGDCLELMNDIPDKSIDCIICDLPYGTTACKWDTIIPFDKLWEQYNRIIKDNGAICLFGSEPFSSMLRMSNLKMYRYDWIWDKKRVSNPMMAKKMPLKNYEIISVFYKKQPIYNPQPTKKNTIGKLSYKDSDNTHCTETLGNSNLYFYENKNEFGFPKMLLTHIKILNNLSKDKNGFHPTQKPIELIEYLIKTYSNEGDLILDNTAGSMTTAIASINTNRKCICIEKDDHYFEIGSERVSKHLQEQQFKLF